MLSRWNSNLRASVQQEIEKGEQFFHSSLREDHFLKNYQRSWAESKEYQWNQMRIALSLNIGLRAWADLIKMRWIVAI